jgi:hypothetical protein
MTAAVRADVPPEDYICDQFWNGGRGSSKGKGSKVILFVKLISEMDTHNSTWSGNLWWDETA